MIGARLHNFRRILAVFSRDLSFSGGSRGTCIKWSDNTNASRGQFNANRSSDCSHASRYSRHRSRHSFLLFSIRLTSRWFGKLPSSKKVNSIVGETVSHILGVGYLFQVWATFIWNDTSYIRNIIAINITKIIAKSKFNPYVTQVGLRY